MSITEWVKEKFKKKEKEEDEEREEQETEEDREYKRYLEKTQKIGHKSFSRKEWKEIQKMSGKEKEELEGKRIFEKEKKAHAPIAIKKEARRAAAQEAKTRFASARPSIKSHIVAKPESAGQYLGLRRKVGYKTKSGKSRVKYVSAKPKPRAPAFQMFTQPAQRKSYDFVGLRPQKMETRFPAIQTTLPRRKGKGFVSLKKRKLNNIISLR